MPQCYTIVLMHMEIIESIMSKEYPKNSHLSVISDMKVTYDCHQAPRTFGWQASPKNKSEKGWKRSKSTFGLQRLIKQINIEDVLESLFIGDSLLGIVYRAVVVYGAMSKIGLLQIFLLLIIASFGRGWIQNNVIALVLRVHTSIRITATFPEKSMTNWVPIVR